MSCTALALCRLKQACHYRNLISTNHCTGKDVCLLKQLGAEARLMSVTQFLRTLKLSVMFGKWSPP